MKRVYRIVLLCSAGTAAVYARTMYELRHLTMGAAPSGEIRRKPHAN